MKANSLEILEILPNPPASLTSKQVQERWKADRDQRTVQRNLIDMADKGLATYTKDGNTYFWSRATKSGSSELGMSRQNAFAIKTSEPFLQEIVPNSLKKQFDNLFKQATSVLDGEKSKTPWQKKFVLAAPTFPPSHEAIDATIKEEILKAVLEEESLQILYQRPGHEANWRVVFPYGIILSKNTQYLIAAGLKPFADGDVYWGTETADNEKIKAYAIHRISKVSPSSVAFQKVEEFDLQAFAELGITNFKIDFQDIRVNLIAKGATAQVLKNAQLDDLAIDEKEDETVEFEFTTPFTYQFIRWCIAHGHQLYIKSPQILLDKIGEQIRDPRQPF